MVRGRNWYLAALTLPGSLVGRVAQAATEAPMPVSPMGSLLQVLLGLVAVLIAIGASAWLFRRFGRLQTGAQGALRILGGLSLGTRERVVLVEVGETQLLIGVAPGRVQTLHVLDQRIRPETMPAAGDAMPRRFADILRRAGLGRSGSTEGRR